LPNDPGVLGLGGPEYWAIAFDCERRNLAEKVMEASSYGGLSLNCVRALGKLLQIPPVL